VESESTSKAEVIVAAPTPFDTSGALDLAGVRENIARWLAAGVDGILVLGSTGEAIHLADDEAEAVVTAARAAVPHDRTLMVGTGRSTTAATIAWTARAARAGADAALVVTPHYYGPEMTLNVLARYYRGVADGSPVPIFLYSVPVFTGISLHPDLVVELSQHPRIAGLKESSGDVAAIFDEVTRSPADFRVYNGSPRTVYPALAVGARGSVLAVASVAPELAVAAHRAFLAGDAVGARSATVRLARLAARLSPFGIGGFKAAMTARGYRGGLPRQPLAFYPASLPEIEAALAEAELAEGPAAIPGGR
jgi:dihydrodipicolinate synthase/N-acetylneuraminate lyase